jgi:hypothetical protein
VLGLAGYLYKHQVFGSDHESVAPDLNSSVGPEFSPRMHLDGAGGCRARARVSNFGIGSKESLQHER